MKLNVIVHEAEEGGYWAEVPSILGCATQGDTFSELLHNLYEAVEACLSVDVQEYSLPKNSRMMEIAVCKLFLAEILPNYSNSMAGS